MNVTDLPKRFHSRIDVSDQGYTSPCWMWTGANRPNGYGISGLYDRETKKQTVMSSHVVVYLLLVGDYDRTLQLDHLCEVRACCNPEHLEPVTAAENLRRAFGRKSVDHCKYGHDLRVTGKRASNGRGRRCSVCHAAWQLAAYHRKKKAATQAA